MNAPPAYYKLRTDLYIQRRVFGDQVLYVVKDPLRLKYWTVDESTYALLHHCNGERDLAELTQLAEEKLPGRGFDVFALLGLYEAYRGFKFFEDPWERNILLIEKQRTSRSRALKTAFANPLEIHLPAWNPDRFLERMDGYLGFLFTGKAVVGYVLIFMTAMWISLSNREAFALPLNEWYQIQGRALLGIFVLWFILLGSVVLHEIGHGLATKHFGGGVYRMGFMLMYFNPCMFCDTTESYFFTEKRHKYAVILAGGVVDLMVASLATFVWYLTPPDLFINQVAHRVALYNGVTGIIFNFNPLMKFDGYFVLSDYLEVPNLQGDSFQYLGSRIRSFFGMSVEPDAFTPRQRRIFRVYGTLSIIYVIFALSFIFYMVSGWLVRSYRATGYVLAAILFFLMTKKYLKGLVRFMRFATLDKKGSINRHPYAYPIAGALLVVVVLFVPVPRHVHGDFSLRPGVEVVIRAPETGVVESVLVAEGDFVRADEPIMSLREELADLQAARTRSSRVGAEAARAAAVAAQNHAQAVALDADIAASDALEAYYQRIAGRSLITAPLSGVVLTSRLHELVGVEARPGDSLVEIGDVTRLRAEVLLDEQLLGLLGDSGKAELRPFATPGVLKVGTVLTVSQEPSGGVVRRLYRIIVEIDNADGALRPGMTGRARFDAGRVPLAMHLGGWLSRMLRLDFWV